MILSALSTLHSTVALLEEMIDTHMLKAPPSLHSTVALLEERISELEAQVNLPLHSTVALLEDNSQLYKNCAILSFTFYCSSIRRNGSSYIYKKEHHLHSTVALLEAC